ncbi:uncharacterized protein LOC101462299 [Ceratitis capitata]|uniref:uncharacterized protein LOC101462299 n=1 Tax=Ceratitis capitata TaxID=7213 RepID=UPI000329BE36|nr:uncharacterized protein LOC101462299 [Ceratitis capitata]
MKNAFFIGNALLWLQLFEIFSQYLKLTVAAQASLTNIKCTSFNKTFVSFAECRLNLVQRGFNEYSISLKVHQPPIENVTVHLQFMKKSNGYHPYMVDTIFDACKFMNTKSNPLLKYLYGFLRPYTNVNHSCPYNHDLIVKNLRIDQRLLNAAAILPTGDYAIFTNWMMNNKKMARLEIYMRYQEYK